MWRWMDAATFGSVALLLTAGAVWSLASGAPFGGKMTACAAAAGGWLVYGALLYRRWLGASRVAFRTPLGIDVQTNGYAVTAAEVDVEARLACTAMAGEFVWTRDALLARLAGVRVVFVAMPFTHPARPGQLAGLWLEESRTALVGYRRPLSASALRHELEHAVGKLDV